jgi:cytochrome b
MSLDAAIADRATDAKAVPPRNTRHSVRLWDLPLRIFHWGLVAAVTVAIVTGQVGGDWMRVHGIAGLVIVGLVAFRLVWGFVGSTHARFTRFAPSPRRVLAYVKGQWRGVGHNPLGALSVFALLGLLAAQAVTGLFGNDEIAFTGPLAARVAEETSLALTNWHHQFADWLLALIGLHVVAIVAYLVVKKNNLIKPMLTGRKNVEPHEPQEPAQGGGWLAFVFALAVALGAVYAASGAWQSAPEPAPAAPATPAAPSPGW